MRNAARPGRVDLAAAALLVGLALAGCGLGANSAAASLPAMSVGPVATVGGATAQTRGVIATALSSVAVQFGDATRPYRPAESPRLRDARRAVYQIVLPNEPDAGYIVVYEFADASAAVDAGNEEAGYLGTGPAKVQYQRETQHVLRQLGPTLILYSWSTTTALDPALADAVATALNTIGIGFTVPR